MTSPNDVERTLPDLRQLCRRPGGVKGMFVKLAATEVIDLAVGAGLHLIVVDLEHSQLSEGDALRLLRYARALAFPALARIPEVDRGLVNRLLEAGGAGIQLSTVRRAGQVEALVQACRYAPYGSRSISLAHAAARYGGLSLSTYLSAQDAVPTLVVAQIETALTDDPLDAIMAEALDIAFVGTTDLTVEYGLAPDRVTARVHEIIDAAEKAGVIVGGFGLTDPRVRFDISTSDLALLRTALNSR